MKKTLILLSVMTIATISFAANPFDNFTGNITGVAAAVAQQNIDNFAKDLGGLMGGGAFHQGRTLGFPGFDIGIHVPAKKTNADNIIVKEANLDTIFLPVLQAEIGLPAKFDLLGRFSTYADATLVGGGVRYGILRSGIPGIPSLSVQGMYNALDVKSGENRFKATAMSLDAVLSIDLPVVTPYVGAGFDSTTVEPDLAVALPKPGLKGTASGFRLEGGVNLALFPLTYLQLGAAVVNGDLGYVAGLGVKY